MGETLHVFMSVKFWSAPKTKKTLLLKLVKSGEQCLTASRKVPGERKSVNKKCS